MEKYIEKKEDALETKEQLTEKKQNGEISSLQDQESEPDMYHLILEKLEKKEKTLTSYSPVTLAYIGDCFYELIVRTKILSEGNCAINKMSHHANFYSKAPTQSKMIDFLMEELTEEEKTVYRRGRNTKTHTTAKNASVADYRKATGFEAMIGYLYLTGQTKRILELVKKAMEEMDEIRRINH